jgi:poly(3-hydroxyalkanoate) synthetase
LTDGLTLWGVRPAHWNSDSTRMLAKMRSFYLRHMYMKNLLAMPGGIEPDGVPIELSKVNCRPVSSRRWRIASHRGRRRTRAQSTQNTRARRSKSTIAPRR